MLSSIFTFSDTVMLVGGGPLGREAFNRARSIAGPIVCADSGADQLAHVAPEASPDAVIGDLDSLKDREAWRKRLGGALRQVSEQDSTDFEKCLRAVDAPAFVGVGFLGGRVDHQLASLHAIVADPRPIVLLGEEDAIISAGLGLTLNMSVGDRVSIFPLSPSNAIGGSGLRWPIDGLVLAAGSSIGVSNAAVEESVTMRFDRPGAVVILQADRAGVALDAARRREAT